MRRIAAIGLFLAVGMYGAMPAWAQPAEPIGRARLQVVASFSILGDMVKNVAGERVDLRILVGPGIDAHDYQPNPRDAQSIKSADLIIANGLGFEPWLDRLTQAAQFKGQVAITSAGINPRQLRAFGKSLPDPHAWQDLTLGQIYVRNIAQALARTDPDHGEIYRTNALAYSAKLERLDKSIKDRLAKIDPSARKVLTNHGAFGYFGAAYGIEFIGLKGASTDSELSARSLRGIIDQVRSEKITVLFIEHLTDPRLLAQIAQETGAHMGGDLFADSLAKPGQPGDTYLGMFDYNISQLLDAIKTGAKD